MPPRKTTRNYGKRNYTGTTFGTTTHNFTKTGATYACNSPRFTTARYECQWRMGSYRNVYSQFMPTGTKTVFSPTAANKWIKYVNTGTRVYKWTNVQFTKQFGQKWTQASPTAIRQFMRKKFGTGIKDIIRGKGNCWLVATTKNVTGRPFTTYNWK